jgi:hypothetical protein
MQLSVTVEGMDITDRHTTGTARAVYPTVNNRECALGLIRQKACPAGCADGRSGLHEEGSGGKVLHAQARRAWCP